MQKKRKLKKGYRCLKGLYWLIVVVSVIIVTLYIAYHMAVKEPEMKDPKQSKETAQILEKAPDDPTQTNEGYVRKEKCYTFLLAASDDGNGNADTIMVMTYDIPNQKIGVVSIPRDTLIRPGTYGFPKINAVYSQGIEPLKDAVSDLVGFPIDYHIVVDMQAFQAIVDAVGGIDFNVPINMDYDDSTKGKELYVHFKAGMQHLDGSQALAVARFRKNSDGTGYLDSDIGRTHTQQQLMQTMAEKVLSFSSLTKLDDFVKIFSNYVETDLSVNNLAFFASKAVALDLNTGIKTGTLPGDGSVTCKGVHWCYQLYPKQVLKILNETVNPFTEDLMQENLKIYQVK